MDIETDLSVRLVPGRGDDEEPLCELLLKGEPTGKTVPGAVLEAAVRTDTHHLLFLTDDVPYEEMLRILLLDRQWNVLDSAVIGSPYSTGSFESLAITAPDTVQFRFIGHTTWSVQVLPRPQLRVPLVSEPRGVFRSLGFSRHFIVRGNPVRATA